VIRLLSRKNYVGYALGDLSNGLSFGMSSTFLLAFYTDILGITAVAAGTLFLVARMVDAISDPLMGALTDKIFQRRQRKAGTAKINKFKPFILYGSIPVVLASVLLFVAPENLTTSQKLVWAYATYITWGMIYTFINIPYGSMAAAMTQHPVERVSLSAARSVGGALGSVIDRAIVPIVLSLYVDEQAKAYLIAMGALGLLAFAGYIICYFTVEENVQTKPDVHEKFSLRETFSVIWKNRPFVAVSVASLGLLAGFGTSGAMTIYFFRENLQALDLMALSGITVIGPIILAAPLIPRLIGRFGMKNTFVVSCFLGFASYVILFMLPTTAYVYLLGSFIAHLFLIIPMMSLWGMVSDSIDYNQYLSGIRQEGVIYGAYSFIRKTGQAFAGFLSGWGLSASGYIANAESQSDSALAGIKFMTIGTPAIGLLVSACAFLWIWNLTPEKQREITQAIST